MDQEKFAKALRKKLTPQEIKLWYLLRDRRFINYKFRRQVLIDKYIVDFCCFVKRLIIEVDGGHHNKESEIIKDRERDRYLRNQGFNVIRFWNSDIDNNQSEVLDEIWHSLK